MRRRLYPLRFEPIYMEKVWGGRRLEEVLGRKLPGGPEKKIGESWELADLSETSESGGGGGEKRSVVANGWLAGRRLHDLIEEYGRELMGDLLLTEEGNFPLLVKYLDAGENLSVQVHPNREYVRRHPGTYLKSEAWYVVAAEEGAVIYKGLKEGTDAEAFRRAVRAGDGDAIEGFLRAVPVKAGDCHYLPSGTCHALGAGVVVAEVQTPSDTTFRLYDWGRKGRAMHIEEALECMEYGPPRTEVQERRSHIAGPFTTVSRLISCEYFCIEKVRMVEGYEQEIPYREPVVWMVLEGRGVIDPGNGEEAVEFQRGQTLLIPAGLEAARVKLMEDSQWLEISFPQAGSWRLAGGL